MTDQEKTLDKRLDDISLEMAHIEWSMGRDMKLLKTLTVQQQEICGEIGHEWDETFGSTCVKCGLVNLGDYDENGPEK